MKKTHENDYYICYINPVAGVSGDMLLASFIDAGYPVDLLQTILDSGNLNCELQISHVKKNGIKATKLDVIKKEEYRLKTVNHMKEVLFKMKLNENIKKEATYIIDLINKTEAEVHGKNEDETHFHELGDIDTIIDIIGVLHAIEYFNIKECYSSPVPVSRGYVNTCHGIYPAPAPATSILLKDIPIFGINESCENITPTGIAIIKSIVRSFCPFPEMTVKYLGNGAGNYDLKIPNILRVWIGLKDNAYYNTETIIDLETNIDDMNPQWYDLLIEKLLENGALDVCIIPSYFKKNRPGILLKVLLKKEDLNSITDIIFKNTTTSGLRYIEKQRKILSRQEIILNTKYGQIRGKSHEIDGKTRIYPEYDDIKMISKELNVPIEHVYREFLRVLEIKDDKS